MTSLEALDQQVRSLINKNKLSSSAVDAIVKAALEHVSSDTSLITLLYRQHKKASPTHKLTSLYLIDAVARAARSQYKKEGKTKQQPETGGSTTPKDEPPQGQGTQTGGDGTCGSFLKKLEGLLSKIVLDVWENAPHEHREKVRKVMDIWTKAGTFSSSALARLGNKLLAVSSAQSENQSPAVQGSPVAPQMSPTGPTASPGLYPPPQQQTATGDIPIPANVLALLQATTQSEPSQAAKEQLKREEEERMIARVLAEAQGGPRAFEPSHVAPLPLSSSTSNVVVQQESNLFPRPSSSALTHQHPSSSSSSYTSSTPSGHPLETTAAAATAAVPSSSSTSNPYDYGAYTNQHPVPERHLQRYEGPGGGGGSSSRVYNHDHRNHQHYFENGGPPHEDKGWNSRRRGGGGQGFGQHPQEPGQYGQSDRGGGQRRERFADDSFQPEEGDRVGYARRKSSRWDQERQGEETDHGIAGRNEPYLDDENYYGQSRRGTERDHCPPTTSSVDSRVPPPRDTRAPLPERKRSRSPSVDNFHQQQPFPPRTTGLESSNSEPPFKKPFEPLNRESTQVPGSSSASSSTTKPETPASSTSFDPTSFSALSPASWSSFVTVLRESHPYFVTQKARGEWPTLEEMLQLCGPSAFAIFGNPAMRMAAMAMGTGGAEIGGEGGGGTAGQDGETSSMNAFNSNVNMAPVQTMSAGGAVVEQTSTGTMGEQGQTGGSYNGYGGGDQQYYQSF